MWIRLVSLVARIGLAAVWLISGGMKAADPAQTEIAVRAYQLLPESLVSPVSLALPAVEIALGLLLLLGLGVRIVAGISAVMLIILIAVIASVWARGLSIECGCFGGGGDATVSWTAYPEEIARDLGFALMAFWLLAKPRTIAALGPNSRAATHSSDSSELEGSAT